LKTILEEIRAHGAHAIALSNVDLENPPTEFETTIPDVVLEPAPADGKVPAGAYVLHHLPSSVHLNGQWHRVDRKGFDAIVITAQKTSAGLSLQMIQQAALKKGDLVVVGRTGIRWA
jgi:hypothetical protein